MPVPHTRPIFLTNTLGRKVEEFHAINPPRVTIYTCGPTVYNYQHIGNFRAFIFADTLRRMLEYNGYQVTHVRNITDVGHLTNDTLSTGLDKIEATARAHKMSPWDIAKYYTDIFLRDGRRLNLKEPEHMPRATEYIEPMIGLVERLVQAGHGYASDGNVYYEVSTFPRYGILSGNTVADLVEGARVEVGEGKRAPADFALWRAAEPDKLMRWSSPWGEGVPGWHLECSAMAMKLLGEQIDIHTGGEDHVFPHHEDEIAQSEGATGKQFARYWLHNAFLLVGEKMSKSLGNFYTVSDIVERGIQPLAYRYFNFQAHYRTPLNFTWEALEGAHTALVRLWQAAAELVQEATAEDFGSEAEDARARFHEAINRDLDMPGAVAVLHDVMGSKLPSGQKLALVADFDRVLGLNILEMGDKLSGITQAEEALLREREAARKQKDWPVSDEIRSRLAEGGLEVKDTPRGQRWFRTDLAANGSDEP